MAALTNEQIEAAIQRATVLIHVIEETVQEVGTAPENIVFLALNQYGVSAPEYQSLIDCLVRFKSIKRKNHQLIWVGKRGRK